MASRLDRLVTLLETGSTQLIRNTAAQQLADVQKAHPDELFNLLSRVVPYLTAKSWDTRIATAKALGGIVDHAEKFNPNDTDTSKSLNGKKDNGTDGERVQSKQEPENSPSPPTDDDHLHLETLDIASVLTYGKKLLGSAGREYNYSLASLDSTERLAFQKKNLTKRLGLGGEYLEDDLIGEEDFTSQVSQSRTLPRIDTSTSGLSRKNSISIPGQSSAISPLDSSIQTPTEEGGLSKRQLNLLKRKHKMQAKGGGPNKVRIVDLSSRRPSTASDALQTPIESEPSVVKLEPKPEEASNGVSDYFSTDRPDGDDSTKVVSEFKGPAVPETSVLQTELEEEGRHWPFERLCEFLTVDLFDPAWETRHGAAMGLREIIRSHGAGAGRQRGKSQQQNDELNRVWLDDLACRLCCVFMLDRFGDYISDNVVAPIRETVGQTLGALLLHLAPASVRAVYDILRQFVMQDSNYFQTRIWEVCHGGMLGLKYLVAVRKDLLKEDDTLVDGVTEAVLKGLGDYDDDVRAVSAATLIPIAQEVIKLRPASLRNLINIVWNCLSDIRDDLSASTGSVMDLLAKLCSFQEVLEAMKDNAASDPEQSFGLLVPRLYPFLRHTITSVRSAVLRALQTFLNIQGKGTEGWVDARVLTLVFQNLLVERNEAVLELSYRLWSALIIFVDGQDHNHDARAWIEDRFGHASNPLLLLTLHPIGVSRYPIPMDRSLFMRPSGEMYGHTASSVRTSSTSGSEPAAKRRKKQEKSAESTAIAHNVDGHMIAGDVDLVGMDTLIRTRIYAAKAIGQGLQLWHSIDHEVADHGLLGALRSPYASTRLHVAMIIEEAAKPSLELTAGPAYICRDELISTLDEPRPKFYRDLVSYTQVVRAQCHSLLNNFRDVGKVSSSRIPTIAVVVQEEEQAGPDAFSIDHADRIANEDYDRLMKLLSPAQRIVSTQLLSEARADLLMAINEAKKAKEQRDVRVMAAVSGALVACSYIPDKPSLLIKGLMDSVKTEENAELQKRSASSVAVLIQRLSEKQRKGIVDKVITNLVKFCCQDTSETPEFDFHAAYKDKIISLRKEEDRIEHEDPVQYEFESRAAKIQRRGSKEALEQVLKIFGDSSLDAVPKLRALMVDPLVKVFRLTIPKGSTPTLDSVAAPGPEAVLGQEAVDALSMIRTLTPAFPLGLYDFVRGQLDFIITALCSELSVFRYAAAKCFATICSIMPVKGMTLLVEQIIPLITDPTNLAYRQGAIECIYRKYLSSVESLLLLIIADLISVMEDRILPYVIFLIVPVLGRMSDSDHDIRLIATTTFATLVKLVPLEAGIPDPPGMPEKLLKGRDRERKFIAQMLDPQKVEPFPIPVAIKAELRSYQQDGVNWLAFLNRYHLHGILCDDMGLGKTLQTLCIVASDHHMRAEEFAKTKAPDVRRLPSLIICPPTLSGHWQQEIKTYAPFLTCLAFVGPPGDRNRLKGNLGQTDVVITSYDICRNDIDTLCQHNWNYCVLDEGHLIKNPKAKISQAVKRLASNHRLILSGTPIQNNVLELWSLFDFLMPGFLGTEKVFLDRFAKPIAASRFSKSSSKEQEAGALAIEALHKQVLPFLLRRLKEEVLDDLPPKILQNYYCDLSDLQKTLFQDFTKKEGKTLADKATSGDREAKQHIFQALQYMRKLCNSPALVVKEGHKQYNEIQRALAQKKTTLTDPIHAPKLMALRDLLVDCGIGVDAAGGSEITTESNFVSQHRVLIFCQMKEMLDMVQNNVLKEMLPSVQYLRLDGSVEANKRQDIVNKFNSDPSFDALLLTTSVGGLGLNLTGADTVIFVEHDWNPQKDLQAMDRAHRIGQKKVVNVYRLVTRGTLEEKILK